MVLNRIGRKGKNRTSVPRFQAVWPTTGLLSVVGWIGIQPTTFWVSIRHSSAKLHIPWGERWDSNPSKTDHNCLCYRYITITWRGYPDLNRDRLIESQSCCRYIIATMGSLDSFFYSLATFKEIIVHISLFSISYRDFPGSGLGNRTPLIWL